MITAFKMEHKGWHATWHTRHVDAVDASWIHNLLDILASTEGLRLAFYYSEEEFLEAVERTVMESTFWKMYHEVALTILAPMCGGHVQLDLEKDEGDGSVFEVPF